MGLEGLLCCDRCVWLQLRVFVLFWGLATIAVPGCIVEGKCFGDGDCAAGQICQRGVCLYECAVDDDCGSCRRCVDRRCTECCRDSDCGKEEYCDDEVCIPAPGCLSCAQLDHGNGVCLHGICLVEACELGFHDVNGEADDGCEYGCDPVGAEECNGVDDDCDGRIDEDFNLARDVSNCGACGDVCDVPAHAEAVCAGGDCYFQCLPGFYDNDGMADNGCEDTYCEPTAGGIETCDLRDNDCDGEVDEDIVKDATESCGPVCDICVFDNASASCVGGTCVMVQCNAGYHDWDLDPANGCEGYCVPTNPPAEVCDGLDNDCDGSVDEGLVCECPAGMVVVESAFCIDQYEASRPDATASSMGNDTSYAVSQPGVMPWKGVSFSDAVEACSAAGKRLCEPSEWEQACRGPDDTTYCYGDEYEEPTCNGIDAFEYPQFHVVPTGAFPGCTNEYGVFDINGNVWERVQVDAQYPGLGSAGRGGAYNCGDSEMLHRCDYEATWGNDVVPNFGFRCCL